MQKRFILIFLCNLLITLYPAHAQIAVSHQKALYEKVLVPYIDFYNNLTSGTNDIVSFTNLFEDEDVIIMPNDFNNLDIQPFTGIAEYINEITRMFDPRNYEEYSHLQVSLPKGIGQMFFCEDDAYKYVWLKKTFYYHDKTTPVKVDHWVRLKIQQQLANYKIVEVVRCEKPVDYDNDRIANVAIGNTQCDLCQGTQAGDIVDVRGCSIEQRHEVRATSHIRHDAFPHSGLILSVSGAWLIPFGTPYNNKNILNTTSNEWNNNGNLATNGLMYNISLQYYFSRRLGIALGGMHIRNKIDNDDLQKNIALFLAGNHLNNNDVNVSSNAYEYTFYYFQPCIGGFKNQHHSLKFEPTIGMALNGFTESKANIAINYNDGIYEEHPLSFKTNPFPMYGGAVKYEAWLVPARFGLSFSGYYLRSIGTTRFSDQEVRLRDNAATLRFTNQQIQLIGASFGLQVYLVSGRKKA